MKKLFEIFKLALHPKNWKTLYKDYKEIINYIIFGVLTTVVSFASYYVIRGIFPNKDSVPDFLKWIYTFTGKASDTPLPTLVSWICSVTFAYITNRKWVFESKAHGFGKVTFEAASFYASRLFTLLVDLVIMYLLVDLTGIKNPAYEFCAKLFSNVFVLVLNYVLSKLLVFRKKKE